MDRPQPPETPWDLPRAIGEQLKRIIEGAPAERAAAIDALCAQHPSLASRICDAARNWTPTLRDSDPAAARTANLAAESATDPEWIGPYKILNVLGSGGMGKVYLAEQTTPVRRRVAIKIVKLGLDTEAVLRRFELERQALAVMNHDNIARVLDAGATAQGQPYFVMEHVPGLPLTQFCDRNKLALEDRIRLFQQVCAGVHHAHQKGVIHRDLKPLNVLVSEAQGRPVPKIIDFGLARATNHVMLQASLMTELGQVIGTPEYMSPEQADPTASDIDTRADIYTLGVMLYEILVGTLPFTSQELRRTGLREMQRMIREDDPPRPSTRLSSIGDASTRTAAARQTTPAILLRALRSDLDWVVLKAMDKDRNRRYESAAGLAVDLERYLDHEPVIAGPPGAGYRLRKFVRRYRGQVSAAAIVLVTLLAGIAGTTLFAIQSEARASQIERQKGELQATAARLSRSDAEFRNLKNVALLTAARETEAALYPAWPDRIDAMEAWLATRWAPIRNALSDLTSTVRDLEARRRAPTPAERAELAATVQQTAEPLRLELAALRRAHAVRENRAQASTPELDEDTRRKSAAELNALAWPLVSHVKGERRYGAEATGLAYAQLAATKIEGGDASIAPRRVSYTLAFALFANGLDAAALREARSALEIADAQRKPSYAQALAWLEKASEAAAGTSGRAAIAAIEREIAEVAMTAERALPPRFDDPADQFLHDTLARLVDDVHAFEAERVTAVRARLRWARRIAELSIDRHADRWDRARAAIRAADGVAASTRYQNDPPLDLAPQIGLVPIGKNPRSGLWEFYHLRSAWDPAGGVDAAARPIPTHRDDGSLDMDGETGIVFVLIPGGTFTMGAQNGNPALPHYDEWAVSGERTTVRTVAPFFMARHELTQGQWSRLDGGENPSFYRPPASGITLAHPVEQVTWTQSRDLLAHHGLTLPTEAQWEYACRAGTDTRWYSGEDPKSLAGFANLVDEYSERHAPWFSGIAYFDDGHSIHAPVGTFRPNDFGLFDAHGNVWEWCADVYLDSERRIYRGGSFRDDARASRSRFNDLPDFRDNYLGVRAARAVVPQR